MGKNTCKLSILKYVKRYIYSTYKKHRKRNEGKGIIEFKKNGQDVSQFIKVNM